MTRTSIEITMASQQYLVRKKRRLTILLLILKSTRIRKESVSTSIGMLASLDLAERRLWMVSLEVNGNILQCVETGLRMVIIIWNVRQEKLSRVPSQNI